MYRGKKTINYQLMVEYCLIFIGMAGMAWVFGLI